MPTDGRATFARVAVVATGVSALLVVLSVVTHYVAYRLQVAQPGSAPIAALGWFDVNRERNVPTAWAAALLLGSAVLAAVAAARRRRPGDRAWWLVAAVAGYLALDEWFALHERLESLGTAIAGDAVHFTWVVPAVAVTAVVGAVLLAAVAALPTVVRHRLTVAGGVYVLGALGLETLSGVVLREAGPAALYLVVTAGEEWLEMVGASVLLATTAAVLPRRRPRGRPLTLVPGSARSGRRAAPGPRVPGEPAGAGAARAAAG